MFAWDVKQTTYTLADGKLTATGSKEIADNVLPGQLEKKFPELTRAGRSGEVTGCA